MNLGCFSLDDGFVFWSVFRGGKTGVDTKGDAGLR